MVYLPRPETLKKLIQKTSLKNATQNELPPATRPEQGGGGRQPPGKKNNPESGNPESG